MEGNASSTPYHPHRLTAARHSQTAEHVAKLTAVAGKAMHITWHVAGTLFQVGAFYGEM